MQRKGANSKLAALFSQFIITGLSLKNSNKQQRLACYNLPTSFRSFREHFCLQISDLNFSSRSITHKTLGTRTWFCSGVQYPFVTRGWHLLMYAPTPALSREGLSCREYTHYKRPQFQIPRLSVVSSKPSPSPNTQQVPAPQRNAGTSHVSMTRGQERMENCWDHASLYQLEASQADSNSKRQILPHCFNYTSPCKRSSYYQLEEKTEVHHLKRHWISKSNSRTKVTICYSVSSFSFQQFVTAHTRASQVKRSKPFTPCIHTLN